MLGNITEGKTSVLSLATLGGGEHTPCGGIQQDALQLPHGPHAHVLPCHGNCTQKNQGDRTETGCPQTWATVCVYPAEAACGQMRIDFPYHNNDQTVCVCICMYYCTYYQVSFTLLNTGLCSGVIFLLGSTCLVVIYK